MKSLIKEYFEKAKIEYYAALDFNHSRVTNASILERAGFTPRSVIIYLVPYYVGECENISVYAGSLDYHILLSSLGAGVVEAIKGKNPLANAVAFGDHSPIDERHAAALCGLGVLGKNGLLINERYGSYIFIGEVLCDIAPEDLGAVDPLSLTFCSGCGACTKVCPTGALFGCGECLSAITQKKGALSQEEADLLIKFNTVWGCDICQAVCPHNFNPKLTPIDFFYKDRIVRLDKDVLASLSKEEFTKRAFAWRGIKTVERNIEIVENENSK